MALFQPKKSNLFIDTIKEIPNTVSRFRGAVSDFLRPTQTTEQIQQERRQTLLPSAVKKIKTSQAAKSGVYSPTSDPMSFYKDKELYIDPNFVGSIEKVGKNVASKVTQKVAPKVFEGFEDLTTKTLNYLKGRSTVSRQFIDNLTNQPDLKQVERDLIRKLLKDESDIINVQDFAKKVKAELLPLKVKNTGTQFGVTKYEGIALPKEQRGNVKDYKENIYESPIKTSAGSIHFGELSDKYFGHTRIEDMADNQTRRVIEVQSDLYQKGNLESEFPFKNFDEALNEARSRGGSEPPKGKTKAQWEKEAQNLAKQWMEEQEAGKKFLQYNDPTAHFRMIREEIKKAAQDGKTKLQFPTGETAMKIEGLGVDNAMTQHIVENGVSGARLTPQNMKVGMEFSDTLPGLEPINRDRWIITDVLGDGKFKAVPKSYQEAFDGKSISQGVYDTHKEQFDISGKVDTSNPIYKFYEKDVRKFIQNNFNAKLITDQQGVQWWEVDIKPDQAKKPVQAFGKIGLPTLLGGAGAGALFVEGLQPSTVKYEKPGQENPIIFQPRQTVNLRGIETDMNTINQAKRSIMSEISNRLKPVEVTAMLNVAVNKAKQEGRDLADVLSDPDFFQGVTNKRYNLAATSSFEGPDKVTWDFVNKVIDNAVKGGLQDHTGGATHFVHVTSGPLKNSVVTMNEDEFSEYLSRKGKARDIYAQSLLGQ